ncbi:hypothetical protein BC830DRAFT_1172408 [Chytriomyces sp. MP71]|nr:hypothetical protein BC830DRAFT_1172408 [Chytriomyces sp. MP71]
MRLVSKLDLTNKLAPIDSYAVMFNAVGLQYLTPNYLPNDSCDVVKFRNVPYAKCNIDKLVSEKGVQRYNLPDLHKAIRVTVTPSSNIPNTWTISVTSAYSRICFIETTRGVGREYPFLIWTGKVMPSNFSATDKSAVSFVNNLGDESLFGLQLNTTQIKEQEFRTDSISMQAGCYVDDLQYLPTWRDLETKILPDWVTLFGTGYAGLTVTSSFNLSESHL